MGASYAIANFIAEFPTGFLTFLNIFFSSGAFAFTTGEVLNLWELASFPWTFYAITKFVTEVPSRADTPFDVLLVSRAFTCAPVLVPC